MVHTFVKDVMVSDLATLDSSTTIKNAAKTMDEENIYCIIVTRQNAPDETVWEAARS